MPDACWMDFSGAPAILIPEPLAEAWNGMFVPMGPDQQDADLTLRDGRMFRLHDCDFERPVTDYDRLCQRWLSRQEGPIFTHPVGPGTALVIDPDGDGVVGWWSDQKVIVTISQHLPDPERLDTLTWGDEIRWRIPGTRLILMNSTLHGADPGKSGEDHLVIEMEAGEYSISRSEPEDDLWYLLHRFRRTSATSRL